MDGQVTGVTEGGQLPVDGSADVGVKVMVLLSEDKLVAPATFEPRLVAVSE